MNHIKLKSSSSFKILFVAALTFVYGCGKSSDNGPSGTPITNGRFTTVSEDPPADDSKVLNVAIKNTTINDLYVVIQVFELKGGVWKKCESVVATPALGKQEPRTSNGRFKLINPTMINSKNNAAGNTVTWKLTFREAGDYRVFARAYQKVIQLPVPLQDNYRFEGQKSTGRVRLFGDPQTKNLEF